MEHMASDVNGFYMCLSISRGFVRDLGMKKNWFHGNFVPRIHGALKGILAQGTHGDFSWDPPKKHRGLVGCSNKTW